MKSVNITLNEEQARVLSWLLASVGGSVYHSGRRITEQISEKLWDVNMGYTLETEREFPFDPERSSIFFER